MQRRPRRLGRSNVGWTAVWILAAWAAGAIGAAPAAAESGWEESVGLQVAAGDSILAARVFDSPDFQHQLVVGESGEGWVLSLVDQSVLHLTAEALVWTEEGLPLPDPARAAEAGAFTVSDGIVHFAAGGSEWSIRPEPPLVGEISVEKLRKMKPEYFQTAGQYQPDAKAVAALKRVAADTEVKVFFGTWCIICKKHLPELLATVGAAGNDRIRISFYGVSEDSSQPADLLRRFNVSATPTMLVLQDGKELGRIEEEPDVSVESDLAYILGVG